MKFFYWLHWIKSTKNSLNLFYCDFDFGEEVSQSQPERSEMFQIDRLNLQKKPQFNQGIRISQEHQQL